jgi:hypothetical protein
MGKRDTPVPTLIDQISNAVKSDKPLPPDPDGEAALGASLRKVAIEKATPVGQASDLADAVSKKTWRFSDNELLVRTVRVNLTGETPTSSFRSIPISRTDKIGSCQNRSDSTAARAASAPPMPSSPTRGPGLIAVPLYSNAASSEMAQWFTGPFSLRATS